MDLIYTIGIIISAIAGALISAYIAKTKSKGEHMVCPLGTNCDVVINGRFSRFLGMRVEKIGLLYYMGIGLFYVTALFANFPSSVIFYAMLVTGASFAFTLYLMITQLIVLKKWCTTCLGSAALSFMIMVLSFLGFNASFGDLLFGLHDILEVLFVAAAVVGVLVTSLYARTFIKFLKDLKISQREANRLIMFSHTGWVAIGISFLSGLGLVLTDIYGNITESSSFMLTATILGILIVYEVVVNMFFGSKLVDIHFDDHPELSEHEHSMTRKIAFSFLAVGIVSWYLLLLLSVISLHNYSSGFLFILYIILLLVGIGVALFAENLYYKKSLLYRLPKDLE